jgi:hypothetical protein
MMVDAMLRSSQDRVYAYIVDLALWQFNATGDRDQVDDLLIRNLCNLFERYDRAMQSGVLSGSRNHRIMVRALKAAIEATSMVVQSRARVEPFIERFHPILNASGMRPEDVAYRSYRTVSFGKSEG